jgi:hypothetical protein
MPQSSQRKSNVKSTHFISLLIVFLTYLVLWDFSAEFGEVPTHDDERLAEALAKYTQKVQVGPAYVKLEYVQELAKHWKTETSPTCAVLGGFLAQGTFV